jgi:mRNA interferase RelE/StbE
MTYRIFIDPPALKSLKRLDPPIRGRIEAAIDALSENPRPRGCKKLTGVDAWRIRVSDWRIVYSIADGALVVVVVKVGHRRDVYE